MVYFRIKNLPFYVKKIIKYKIDIVMATAVPVLPLDSALGYHICEPVLQVLTSQHYNKPFRKGRSTAQLAAVKLKGRAYATLKFVYSTCQLVMFCDKKAERHIM